MFENFLSRTSALTAINLVQRAAPEVQIAFATYDEHFHLNENLTANHADLAGKIKQTLDAKPPWGPSGMTDAIVAGLDILSPSETGDAVLVITDGGQNTNRLTYADVERRFAGSDVRLFTALPIQPKNLRDSQATFVKEKRRLEGMLQTTGGEIFYLDTDLSSKEPHPEQIQFRVEQDFHNVPDIADSIFRYMAATYRLQITLPANVKKPGDWELKVKGNSGQEDHDLFIRYQPKLSPCSNAKPK